VGIPWLIRAPGQGRSQKIFDNPVSQVDMVPTLLDLMGQPEKKEAFPGHSLVSAMKGGDFEEDHVYVEWNTPNQDLVPQSVPDEIKEDATRVQGAQWRMAVSPDGWKLCLCDLDKSQLFNLKEDPHETTNLFDSGKHQDVIDRLSKKIHDWQERVGDTLEV
jgi:N-acetylglucosamine-6-sulfatase